MSSSGDLDAAQELFGEFLAQLHDPDSLDFESFVARHPDRAADLRLLHRAFRSLRADIDRGEPGAIDDANLAFELGRSAASSGGTASTKIPVSQRGAGWDVDDGETAAIDLRRAEQGEARPSEHGAPPLSVGELVGEGSMGVVHRAWDDSLGRNLAMKVCRFVDDPAQRDRDPDLSRHVSRFVEEAQVTAQLDHPGIVPVHHIGVDAFGHAYFTMKLVRGETLAQILEQLRSGENDWTLVRVVGLLVRVCEAVAYAHAKGVIHRDLKPSNVMVGRYGEVYVMDWGLARVKGRPDSQVLDASTDALPGTQPARSRRSRGGSRDGADSPMRTMYGDVLGTPVFMSPEQARGELSSIGSASDVYSIGAMLYDVLAGRAPFIDEGSDTSFDGVLGRVRTDRPRPLREAAPKAPRALVAICEKAMQRDAGDRYRTAAQLRRALLEWTEGRAGRRRGARLLGPIVAVPAVWLGLAAVALVALGWLLGR